MGIIITKIGSNCTLNCANMPPKLAEMAQIGQSAAPVVSYIGHSDLVFCVKIKVPHRSNNHHI